MCHYVSVCVMNMYWVLQLYDQLECIVWPHLYSTVCVWDTVSRERESVCVYVCVLCVCVCNVYVSPLCVHVCMTVMYVCVCPA